jgi:hypothetical protein
MRTGAVYRGGGPRVTFFAPPIEFPFTDGSDRHTLDYPAQGKFRVAKVTCYTYEPRVGVMVPCWRASFR